MYQRFITLLSLVALVAAFAAPAAADDSGRYLVVFDKPSGLPSHAADRIARAGGTVEAFLPQIGVAIVASDDEGFQNEIALDRSVAAVEKDTSFRLHPQEVGIPASMHAPRGNAQTIARKTVANAVTDPTSASFYFAQWNMRQIEADAAWAAGHLGSPEVTVAVVESGIDYLHPELQGKVDLSRSVSFVPEDDALVDAMFPGVHHSVDLNVGGTMVAGLIACNAVGTACVAPNVTLISVKTVDWTSLGSHARHLQGIIHAVDVGADIIAASYAHIIHSDNPQFKAVKQAFRRAVNYARRNGVFVVAGIGDIAVNEGINVDATVDVDYIPPAQFTHALGISATAPINQADFDLHSGYSNFGYTLVDLAAPGGRRFTAFLDGIASPCTQFSLVAPGCQVDDPGDEFDWIVFAAGNFAMAHVAGLAALMLSEDPSLTPQQLEVRLKQTADDLGAPGRDPFFGWGRINARRAME